MIIPVIVHDYSGNYFGDNCNSLMIIPVIVHDYSGNHSGDISDDYSGNQLRLFR